MTGKAGSKLVVGCVADNNRKYLDQAFRLLQSWRWFAGEHAGSEFYVCVVDSVGADDRALFESLGAKVRLVERFDTRHPPSNKLRFLQLPEVRSFDRVLLLDCDTVVVQDPAPLLDELDRSDFVAKIVDLPTVSHELFEKIYASFDLPLPPRDWHCTVSGTPTIPYFNAGVLAFSKQAMDRFVPEWIALNVRLIEGMAELGGQGNFCEQASLSLAVSKTGIRFSTVGNEMNYPAHLTHRRDDAEFRETDPRIIHYHSLIDDKGYLKGSPFPAVDRRIHDFNQRLKQARRDGFDNRSFWDKRYTENPELGSGQGSRGPILAYKRFLMMDLYRRLQPSTVLDLGCGDMELGSVFPDRGYTGMDLSQVVTQRNQERFRGRSFIAGDFIEMPAQTADLVVCLDVLIHLPDARTYRKAVARLVSSAARLGVVAAYEKMPAQLSDMAFYHEPISETLKAAGAVNVRKIGGYKQVAIYSFGPDSLAGENAVSGAQAGLHRPVFLVGAMRSGTTLLSDLLDHHPSICYCRFELKEVWSAAGIAMASAKTRDEHCDELATKRADGETERKLTDAFLKRMAACKDKEAGASFLNKNPHLCNKLPFVSSLFPDARFIWVHRDLPRVVASIKRLFSAVNTRQNTWHYWPGPSSDVHNRCWHARHSREDAAKLDPTRVFPGGDVRYIAEYWLESNRAVREFLTGEAPGRWLEISEEKFIAEPFLEMARCLASLEMDYTVPEDKLRELDSKRNLEWNALLDDVELATLKSFVRERKADMELIFPGEGRAEAYLHELESLPARDT